MFPVSQPAFGRMRQFDPGLEGLERYLLAGVSNERVRFTVLTQARRLIAMLGLLYPGNFTRFCGTFGSDAELVSGSEHITYRVYL
jgi:hypothetical protein